MTENIVLEILSAFIHNRKPCLNGDLHEGKAFYFFYIQGILPVLAYMDKKWDIIKDENIKKSLVDCYYQTIADNCNKINMFENLSQKLSENKIPHMPVKGWYVRTLYPVPGAKIEVVKVEETRARVATTYNLITDGQGTAMMTDLPVGNYQVTVKEVPNGYSVTTDEVLIRRVKTDETTMYEYLVDKLGSLIIVVSDDRTHLVVPGADVTIKDEDGNVIATGTTDRDGKVTLTKLPEGQYKVIIDRVPDGYTVTTSRELLKDVEANAETLYEFKITKNQTSNPPTITESKPVPTPEPTPVPEQVVKAPKTGDDMMLFVWMMMAFAGMGIISIADYRKRNRR